MSSEPALHKNSPQHNSTRPPAHSRQLHTEYGSRTTKSKYLSDLVSLCLLLNRRMLNLRLFGWRIITIEFTQLKNKEGKNPADYTWRCTFSLKWYNSSAVVCVCVCTCVFVCVRPTKTRSWASNRPFCWNITAMPGFAPTRSSGLPCTTFDLTRSLRSHGPPFPFDRV